MIYYAKKLYLVFLLALFLTLPLSNSLWAVDLQTPENNANNSISNQTTSTQSTLPPTSSNATTTAPTSTNTAPSTTSTTNTPTSQSSNTVTSNSNSSVTPNNGSTNPESLPNSANATPNTTDSTTVPSTPSNEVPNNVLLPSQKLESDPKPKEEKVDVFDTPSTIYSKIILSGASIFIQPVIDDIKGVVATRVVYVGGQSPNPTHNSILSNKTPDYVEGVQILYDGVATNITDIVDAYVKKTIQPNRTDGQFCYKGSLYAPKIFYYNTADLAPLDNYFKKLTTDYPGLESRVTYTKIEDLKVWPAEEQYQKYYVKNNVRYNYYYQSCSIDAILKQIWEIPDSTDGNKNTPSASGNKKGVVSTNATATAKTTTK